MVLLVWVARRPVHSEFKFKPPPLPEYELRRQANEYLHPTNLQAPEDDVQAPEDDVTVAYQCFGKPDDDHDNQREEPRPPIPVRSLTYKKERVRLLYRNGMGRWALVLIVDPESGQPISDSEANKRLAGRGKRAEATAK
jgi:hypothetical protein